MRRYGRGQMNVEVVERKQHVDFKKAMYHARLLEESGELVSVTSLLGKNLSMYESKEIERLERMIRKLDHTVPVDGTYSYRMVGDAVVAVKTTDFVI